jgi:phosphoglucomutase
MPTYYYDPANQGLPEVWIKNINGELVEVVPNQTQTSDTYGYDSTYSELTKTLDTPNYNPVVAEESVSGATTVTILATCKKVVVKNIVGTGDMFYQTSANTPGTPLDGLSIIAEPVNSHFTKLVFTTSGTLTCDVIQYDREDIEVA